LAFSTQTLQIIIPFVSTSVKKQIHYTHYITYIILYVQCTLLTISLIWYTQNRNTLDVEKYSKCIDFNDESNIDVYVRSKRYQKYY